MTFVKPCNRYRHGHCSAINGPSKTYSTWHGMVDRCRRTKCKDYKNYGGRGIKVCERWMNFDNFLADMGERPEGMSIDRIDVDGDYCPENCKWSTNQEQRNNMQRSVFLEYNGMTMTLANWARHLGTMSKHTLNTRYKRKWTPGQILGFEQRKHANAKKISNG